MTTQPTTFNDLPREIQLLIFGKAYQAKQREEAENMKYHIERFKYTNTPNYCLSYIDRWGDFVDEFIDMNKIIKYELNQYFYNKVRPTRWSRLTDCIEYDEEYRKKYIDYQGNEILPEFYSALHPSYEYNLMLLFGLDYREEETLEELTGDTFYIDTDDDE